MRKNKVCESKKDVRRQEGWRPRQTEMWNVKCEIDKYRYVTLALTIVDNLGIVVYVVL